MNDQLAVYERFDQLERAAKALQQSGYFRDVTSTAQAIVKVMAGAELGLPPFASMTGINIIQGKPVLGANVLATLVKNDPRYNYMVKVCDAKDCELAWFEDGKQVGISSFTWDEAKQAGLTEKDNWRKYPSDMLFARAISRGARRFAPGIFGGSPVYTPDEMGVDTNEEGMIEAVVAEVVPQVVPARISTKQAVEDLGFEIPPENPSPNDDISAQAPKELPPPSINLEMALSTVGKSDNKRYGECTADELSKKKLGLRKLLGSDKPLTDDRREEAYYKLEAIRVIEKAVADHKHAYPVQATQAE